MVLQSPFRPCGSAWRHRARTPAAVERHEDKHGLRDLDLRVSVAGPAPRLDLELHRGPPDLGEIRIDRNLVSDMHGAVEGDALHGDRGATSAGPPRRGVSGR